MTAEFKVGDRVEAMFPATVEEIDAVAPTILVKRDGDNFKMWCHPENLSKIVGPEPRWKVGDAVLWLSVKREPIASFIYNGAGWTTHDGEFRESGSVTAAWLDNRIVRLVPETSA